MYQVQGVHQIPGHFSARDEELAAIRVDKNTLLMFVAKQGKENSIIFT